MRRTHVRKNGYFVGILCTMSGVLKLIHDFLSFLLLLFPNHVSSNSHTSTAPDGPALPGGDRSDWIPTNTACQDDFANQYRVLWHVFEGAILAFAGRSLMHFLH